MVSLILPLALTLLAAMPQDSTTTVTTTTTVSRNADPLVDTSADGRSRINYGAGVIKATGSGAPPANGVASNPAQARLMALGAAKADALRNLAMAVSSVQVTSETHVKNFQTESDTVETQLSALLRNPHVIREEVAPDGTATVTVEMPLYGPNSVAAAVFPEVIDSKPEPGTEWTGPEQPAVPLPAPQPPPPSPIAA